MLKIILKRRDLFLLFILGMSSGLPLAATAGTLQAWLESEGFNLKTIGLMAYTGLPYSFKFVWSPFLDAYSFFGIGRRKFWMIATQVILILLFIYLSVLSPSKDLSTLVWVVLGISFVSASQDIVLDAYRREILSDEELGLGASIFVAGYRIALLIGGAFALYLSAYVSWQLVYLVLASVIGIGLIASCVASEPSLKEITPPTTAFLTIKESFLEFLRRSKATELILFILLYKLGDSLASLLSVPFFLKLQFTRSELGLISKTFGMAAAISGGLIGGYFIPRLGLLRSLFVFGVIQTIGILPYASLALIGRSIPALALCVTLENLTSGMGTAAFTAFISILCNKKFSGTQYALFTSVMALPRTTLGKFAGGFAEDYGWFFYFLACTALSIPSLLLILSRGKLWKLPSLLQGKSEAP